jgi:hypothetical protein
MKSAGDPRLPDEGEWLAKFHKRHFLKTKILICGKYCHDNTMTLKDASGKYIILRVYSDNDLMSSCLQKMVFYLETAIRR